ncbi:MAG TPA: alpha-mannosidase, partial [Candidatus Latescibacteria bacterium]|nr:alpha-mannosidase [Candidatus Latescibacterota bacterium]
MESILEYQIAQRLAELGGRIYPQALPLKQWQMQSRCTRDEVVPQPPDSEWHQVDLPAQWGGSEMTTWFRRQITVPKEFAGKVVVLNIHPGGLDTEGLVSINGAPYQGLNTGRNEVLLTRNAEAGQRFEVLIEASAGVKKGPWTFSQCDLAVLQSQVEAFWYDAKVAFEAALVMPEESSERERLLRAVYRSLMKVEPLYGDEGKFLNSISQASEVLRATVYATPKAETGPRALLIGHSHLDTAWGWRKKETVRKLARTFTNTLRCMEQYPEFVFICPPAQLYQFAKEHYPELYQQVKERIAEGRWQIWGGMWIEPDCNLAGGEALIRQILFDHRFLRQEFGLETQALFFPDTYGNTWSLPQIAKKSGIKYFVSCKLYQGDTNVFPHSLFWWEGIDGTRLLSVIAYTYGGEFLPESSRSAGSAFTKRGFWTSTSISTVTPMEVGGSPDRIWSMLGVSGISTDYPGQYTEVWRIIFGRSRPLLTNCRSGTMSSILRTIGLYTPWRPWRRRTCVAPRRCSMMRRPFRLWPAFIPWSVHEPIKGDFDFTGRRNPRANLKGFLDLV